jgi:hypothetical protein
MPKYIIGITIICILAFQLNTLTRVFVKCQRKMRRCKMEKLQPEKAMEMLRQSGIEVTVEQAKLILEFLRKLAAMAVTQYLSK